MSTTVPSLVRLAGEGQPVTIRPNSTAEGSRQILIKATGEDTGGAYCVMEMTAPAGGPWTSPHIHLYAEEAWYVLEGELTYRFGGQTVRATAGSYLLVPRGLVHAFGNTGSTDARYLTFFSPPGPEHLFQGVDDLRRALPTGEPDPEKLAELRKRYGQVNGEFPLGSP